ncbi:MAG: hypothetical protein OXH57_08280 [Ekhidna sp.]|nr:hypothetical protein [Ekhidna sp.]
MSNKKGNPKQDSSKIKKVKIDPNKVIKTKPRLIKESFSTIKRGDSSSSNNSENKKE